MGDTERNGGREGGKMRREREGRKEGMKRWKEGGKEDGHSSEQYAYGSSWKPVVVPVVTGL